MNKCHIFITVVNRPTEYFDIIKSHIPISEKTVNIEIEKNLLKKIHTIEYSYLSKLRIFFYLRIFKDLEEKILIALEENQRSDCYVYLLDEGVWSVFIKNFRKKYQHLKLTSINIQHGIGFNKDIKSKSIRNFINWISIKITGYPALGLGCYGQVGNGAFDIYVAYNQEIATIIKNRTNNKSINSPELIKYALFKDFISENFDNNNHKNDEYNILLAMHGDVAFSGIRCTTYKSLNEWNQIFKNIRSKYTGLKKISFYIRLHPGTGTDMITKIKDHEIFKYSQLDDKKILGKSLASKNLVLGYSSTVLFDAQLLSIPSISIRSECFTREVNYCTSQILHKDVAKHICCLIDEYSSPKTLNLTSLEKKIKEDIKKIWDLKL